MVQVAAQRRPLLRLSATEQLRRAPQAAHSASRSFQASRAESPVGQLGNHIGGIVIRQSALPYPRASQNDRSSSGIFCKSTVSHSPWIGSPAPLRCCFPRGGALRPPAVGPSTTNPSILPLAFRSRVTASVFEATMGRHFGRSRGGKWRSAKSCGTKVIVVSSLPCAPVACSPSLTGS
jgi:hypothetical protein